MMTKMFGRARVTVTGRLTRVDGTTAEIHGETRLGRWRSFLIRCLAWARHFKRGD
jgi:hypothetical protein